MDFSFTAEQEKLRQDLRQYLADNVSEALHHEILHAGHTPGVLGMVFIRKLGRDGWLGLGWPKEYGGQGLSMIEQFIFYEELDRQNIHYGNLSITSLAMTIIRLASEAQKRKFLPPMLLGELEICLGYSEPGAGSDLASVMTRAERDGDDFVINGQKLYTTGAHYASHIWLLARTDQQAHKHKGLSVFLFPLDTPGVTVNGLYTMEREHRTNEVFFDDVRVPASCMVGEENSGFYTIAVALDYERVFLGKSVQIRRELDRLINYCKEFSTEGRTLFDDPVVQDRLVRMHIDVERVRMLNYKVAWMIDQGEVPNAEASLQKVLSSEIQQRIANEGMQLMGSYGQLALNSPYAPSDGSLVEFWLLSPMMRFGGGTNEIQRNIIAQRGLGLPRV
jgi:3-oxocholest-4-en-26-oyl-CoA dehydrogenase alpha subunit